MSSTSAVQSGSTRQDYLNLLVTQLRNQNPLEPMDNNEMASQLTQLGQLEQLESMNGVFAQVLAQQQVANAAAMIGKDVQYQAGSDGQDLLGSGRVDAVESAGGTVRLRVGNALVELDSVRTISLPTTQQ